MLMIDKMAVFCIHLQRDVQLFAADTDVPNYDLDSEKLFITSYILAF